ncbi:MAG: hypothetical protein NVS3B16_27420 [Vulcanimicrobiaceae bacterium]
MNFRTLDDADFKGKRVLVRVDLNVPMESGRVSDATRIERILPTIREIADGGGRVVLLAHFGRLRTARCFCSRTPAFIRARRKTTPLS